MPAVIRKTRTISLRISEPEFEALKTLYAAHGARSISDFVRTSMQRVISEAASPSYALELKVQEIDGKLSLLDGEVARFSRFLEGAVAPHPLDGPQEA
jgi:uncharacterized protein (DUF1778 family)